MTDVPADWEERVAALWAVFDDRTPDRFLAEVEALAGELPEGHPAALHELASAHDALGQEARAAPLYARALAASPDGGRRRQAVIQYASTLRNLGRAEESVRLLTAERDTVSDELDDAVAAFLALALVDTGRERAATGLVLTALARHLPRYGRSVRGYARDLAGAYRPEEDPSP